MSTSPKPLVKDYIIQIMTRLVKNYENGSGGCMNWTGKLDKWGYGRVRFGKNPNRSFISAHRASAAVFLKFDVKSPILVCHHCDNPRCINPDHFFTGTNPDNVADCKSKGRTPTGEKNASCKLTSVQVVEIRSAYAAGETGVSLSRRYGVGQSQIYRILLGQKWKCVLPIGGIHKTPRITMSGDSNPSAKITSDQVSELRSRYSKGETQAALSKAYGISDTQVNRIVSRKYWLHVA